MKRLIGKGVEPSGRLATCSDSVATQAMSGIPLSSEIRLFGLAISRGFFLTCVLFVGLNACDFLLTAKLLSMGSFEEYNPLALYFIVNGGTLGMLLYKGMMVSIAIACCYLIFRQRRGLGLSVLWGGNALLAAVVVYSVLLLTNVITEDTAPFYVYVGP